MAEGESSRGLTISFSGLFWVAVFILSAATGNCSCCGFDRDYVGEYIDARAGSPTGEERGQ